MKQYVQHMVRENIDKLVANSYMNYGVKGLHRLTISDNEIGGIHLFVTDQSHDLHKNLPQYAGSGISLPFQRFNRNVTLKCIKGSVTAWVVKPEIFNVAFLANRYQQSYDAHQFTNTLLESHIGLSTVGVYNLKPNQSILLRHDALVTIGCPHGVTNSYFVYEGRASEVPVYDLWTNQQLPPTQTDIYMPPRTLDVTRLLDAVGLMKN